MHPFDYVVAETERQSGTMREAVAMYRALGKFQQQYANGFRMNGTLIKGAAGVIKNTDGEHRKIPAVFNQGTPAVPPGPQLERAIERWYELINSSQVDAPSRDSLFDEPREIADYITREFLLIHPFADGNGRVGSLVWNFLNCTIFEPEPMPYFFGEGPVQTTS